MIRSFEAGFGVQVEAERGDGLRVSDLKRATMKYTHGLQSRKRIQRLCVEVINTFIKRIYKSVQS